MDRFVIRELNQILCELMVKYQEYVAIADRQRRAIVNNRLDELQDINEELDLFTAAVDKLERERVEVMEELAGFNPVENVKLSDLLAGVDCPEVDEVLATTAQLKDILLVVADRNRVNQGLLKHSREFVRSTIAIVTGFANPQPQQAFQTYGRSGKVNAYKSQQVRLFNRSL